MFIVTLTSCGSRSGISENNEDPGVCGVKDPTLADSNKIIPRTESELNGQMLFMANCRQCHAPMDIQPCIGRSLQHVSYRLPNANYFKIYIQNSDSLKKIGDPYANKLEAENKADYEHNFKILTEKEIQDILNYTNITINMN